MSDDNRNVQKTVGYLEKRGKLKLINSWKKYWFVLEGHLLLYYGSKDEYDSLSPCKGSITLGPTCNVKPYSSVPNGFQIETRSTTVTLRAESTNEQTKWMQAILSTLNQNQNVNESPTRLNHFRYSMERVNMVMNNTEPSKEISQSPTTPKMRKAPEKKSELRESALLDRLQKLGAKSYGAEAIQQNQRKLQFSPKLKEELTRKTEEILMKDDDFCVCEYTKKNKERACNELNNNWKLKTKTESTEALYAEPDLENSGNELSNNWKLKSEALYAEPDFENSCKLEEKQKKTEKRELNKKSKRESQPIEALYAEPHFENSEEKSNKLNENWKLKKETKSIEALYTEPNFEKTPNESEKKFEKSSDLSPKNWKFNQAIEAVYDEPNFENAPDEKHNDFNKNWKLKKESKSCEVLYTEPNTRNSRRISLVGGYYTENDWYPENICENEIYAQTCKKKFDKIEELQCSMEFIEEPNEYECDNELYGSPREIIREKCNKLEKIDETNDFECENEIYESRDELETEYAEPNECFECDNDLYANPREFTEPNDIECENELYGNANKQCSPKTPKFDKDSIYSEPNEELASSIDVDENSGHLYNVPDDDNVYEDPEMFLVKETEKCEMKALKKKKKCEKSDGFLQKLLKHTRKHDKCEDLIPEGSDVDSTLVILTDLQELLEKKKTLIRNLADKNKIEKNDKDNSKSPDLLKDLNDHSSIILENEYSVVCDGIKNNAEGIYCEVATETKQRKELTNLLENFLKLNNEETTD